MLKAFLNFLCILLLLNGFILGSVNFLLQKSEILKKTEMCKKSESPDDEKNDKESDFEDDSDDYLASNNHLDWEPKQSHLLFVSDHFLYSFSQEKIQTPPPKNQN